MKDLTQGNEGRLILNFAIPMLLGNIFQQLYSVINSVIVGNFLGKEALAAVGASFPIIFALISLIIGIAAGSTIIISQYYGAKDIEKVTRAIDTMYIFIFIAGVVVSLVGIIFSEPILRLTRLPEDIIPQAKLYMNVYLAGLVFSFGFNGTAAALRGLGDSKTPLYFLMLSTLTNIGFDLLFILVFHWGIAGAAVATVISQAGAFITAILYLNKHHKLMNFSITGLVFDKDIFRKSIRIGLPSGLQQTFVALGMMALFGIVNGFGTDVIAAYSAAGRIDSFAMLPAMNFSMALSAFVGQNMGAQRSDRVHNGLKATLLMSTVLSIIVTVCVFFFGHWIMRMFTSDQAVIRIGDQYLMIVSMFYLLFGAMFTFNGVMRGAGDTLIPMFITLFSLWLVRIPIAVFLSHRMGETGIWWSTGIAWAAGLIASLIYYRTGNWKRKVVVSYSAD
jgi:putative MATE family efflux protein